MLVGELEPAVDTLDLFGPQQYDLPNLDFDKRNVLHSAKNLHFQFAGVNPSTPDSDQGQISLQPHRKYYLTQYGEIVFS